MHILELHYRSSCTSTLFNALGCSNPCRPASNNAIALRRRSSVSRPMPAIPTRTGPPTAARSIAESHSSLFTPDRVGMSCSVMSRKSSAMPQQLYAYASYNTTQLQARNPRPTFSPLYIYIYIQHCSTDDTTRPSNTDSSYDFYLPVLRSDGFQSHATSPQRLQRTRRCFMSHLSCVRCSSRGDCCT